MYVDYIEAPHVTAQRSRHRRRHRIRSRASLSREVPSLYAIGTSNCSIRFNLKLVPRSIEVRSVQRDVVTDPDQLGAQLWNPLRGAATAHRDTGDDVKNSHYKSSLYWFWKDDVMVSG